MRAGYTYTYSGVGGKTTEGVEKLIDDDYRTGYMIPQMHGQTEQYMEIDWSYYKDKWQAPKKVQAVLFHTNELLM